MMELYPTLRYVPILKWIFSPLDTRTRLLLIHIKQDTSHIQLAVSAAIPYPSSLPKKH